MGQDLNQVQREFVNGVARPMIERLVAIYYELDNYIQDASNLQVAITNNTEPLNDAADGLAPRADAPVLTGQNIAQLLTFATNMRGNISAAALSALIALMVRDVRTVVKG